MQHSLGPGPHGSRRWADSHDPCRQPSYGWPSGFLGTARSLADLASLEHEGFSHPPRLRGRPEPAPYRNRRAWWTADRPGLQGSLSSGDPGHGTDRRSREWDVRGDGDLSPRSRLHDHGCRRLTTWYAIETPSEALAYRVFGMTPG